MSSGRRPRSRTGATRVSGATRAPRRRGRLARAFRGDRPFGFGLLVVVLLLGAMAAGPLERYAAAADRVDGLVAERDGLAGAVDDLEQRARDLTDPEEIELLARSELGLVLPGDEAYVIVGPSPAATAQAVPRDTDEVAWYRQLGRELSELLR